jgi:hypothetical protein
MASGWRSHKRVLASRSVKRKVSMGECYGQGREPCFVID